MKLLTAAAAITTCLLMSGNVMAQNIQIKVDGKAYAGGLNGNDAAKDFAAKLPLKLKFEDFGKPQGNGKSDRAGTGGAGHCTEN